MTLPSEAKTVDRGARYPSHTPPTQWFPEASPRTLARTVGSLYLVVIFGGIFAVGYVPTALIVSGDAATTTRNILAHQTLYRLSLVVHIIILLCNVPLAAIFYDLFRVVSRRVSMLVAFFTLVGTAIEAATLQSQFVPLLLLEGDRSLSAFSTAQLQAQSYASLQMQPIGFNMSLVFFGCYCLAIGYLIHKSSFLPRLLGVMLLIGGACYLTYSLASFLAPDFAALLVPYIQIPSGIAELCLALWLTISGVNVQRWQEQAGITTPQ
jgi:hypothetical protein